MDAMNTGRGLVAAAFGALVVFGAGSAEATTYRTFDGTGNNPGDLGAAGTELRRIVPASAAYGANDAVGFSGVNPREVSNTVFDQSSSVPNAAGASNFLFQWGQFLDHDIDLTNTSAAAGDASMIAPGTDTDMPPGTLIPFTRSEYSDVNSTGARQQINSITAFVDGSNIYGSDPTRAAALRSFTGGKMATSTGDLLPHDPGDPTSYLAGDVRANEQIGLTSMHTLFVREHNWWADRLAAENPTWNDEEIYQEARKMVGAELQAITYNEFLPTLLGNQFTTDIGTYSYSSSIDPSIANEFSTAAYRIGHTMLPNELRVLNEDGTPAVADVPLAEAFFRPDKVATYGIDSILRGLGATASQEIDNMLVDGVRNMLFAMPGMTFGLDLASLNIQRGRDHGLPTYNEMRLVLGLGAVGYGDGSFLSNAELLLMDVYADVNDIDLWVGLLSEIHYGDGMVGETTYAILFDQFWRLMNGDAFWYEDFLTQDQVAEVDLTLLSDIILRNTDIQWMQENVFLTALRDGSGGNETSIPEPAALSLFGLGLVGLLAANRRRRAV
jgi:hypothetical protein